MRISLFLSLFMASQLLLSVKAVFVKGSFHQHATQPCEACHRAPPDIDACGKGCMNMQDDGGTDADVLLKAIANVKRGYSFVGLVGNEELAHKPKHDHNLTLIYLTENQMAAVCTKGTKHCKNPCDPVVPKGSGPWLATKPPINNLHREYIQGVPGVWVQHPCTDPEREQILAYMMSGQDNIRGMEVYNSWVDQAWDAFVPLDEGDIDPIYPLMYKSMAMHYWDAVLRTLKRPVYGLADDDGFVYMGDCDEPVYEHEKRDVQTDGPAWFRFGMGWSMVDVPSANFDAADIMHSVDQGRFYGSTGVELEYNTSGDILSILANEPVIFGATGGAGNSTSSEPLQGFNLTLCAAAARGPGYANDPVELVTNIGCHATTVPPPLSRKLHIDLRALPISAPLFFVRVQAFVRTRYPIVTTPPPHQHPGTPWEFEISRDPKPNDFAEGRLVRIAGAAARRPFVVQSSQNRTVSMVSYFSDGYGDITPDNVTVDGIIAGRDELVIERWAWMQPVFRGLS